MPTYEYACKFCGHKLEAFQSMTAEPLKRCPACKKQGLRRLISGGAGLIFKGSGFYETDYKRSEAAKSGAAAEKKSAEAKSEPAKTETTKPKAETPKPKSESLKSASKSAKS